MHFRGHPTGNFSISRLSAREYTQAHAPSSSLQGQTHYRLTFPGSPRTEVCPHIRATTQGCWVLTTPPQGPKRLPPQFSLLTTHEPRHAGAPKALRTQGSRCQDACWAVSNSPSHPEFPLQPGCQPRYAEWLGLPTTCAQAATALRLRRPRSVRRGF